MWENAFYHGKFLEFIWSKPGLQSFFPCDKGVNLGMWLPFDIRDRSAEISFQPSTAYQEVHGTNKMTPLTAVAWRRLKEAHPFVGMESHFCSCLPFVAFPAHSIVCLWVVDLVLCLRFIFCDKKYTDISLHFSQHIFGAHVKKSACAMFQCCFDNL